MHHHHLYQVMHTLRAKSFTQKQTKREIQQRKKQKKIVDSFTVIFTMLFVNVNTYVQRTHTHLIHQ